MTQSAQPGEPQRVPGESRVLQRRVPWKRLIDGFRAERDSGAECSRSGRGSWWMKGARSFQRREGVHGEPGEREFVERSQVVHVRSAAADVQVIERVLLGREIEIPEDTVVAYDDFLDLARMESGTDVGGFDVADDLDPAANPRATRALS
ncbi:hypothetical protein [Streptomyces sp. NPDC002324]